MVTKDFVMFANLDPIISLVVLIGWAVVSFFNKKKEMAEQEWEEVERPPARPPAPPLIEPRTPQTQQSPRPTHAPMPVPPFGGDVFRPFAAPTTKRATPAPVAKEPPHVLLEAESEGPVAHPSVRLKEAEAAHTRVAWLQQSVEQRMRAVDLRTEKHQPTAVPIRPVAGTAQQLKRSLRQPEGARQAMLASLVFGKPKSLEA